jgi:DNA repair ATPase RecN
MLVWRVGKPTRFFYTNYLHKGEKMNVKVQKTIKLKETPKHVVAELGELSRKIDFIQKQINEIIWVGLEERTENTIDTMRQELSFIDLCLEDCYNITKSYRIYSQEEVRHAATGQNGDDSSGLSNVDGLEAHEDNKTPLGDSD